MSGSVIQRWFFIAIGSLFFALGFIGVFLPVLPTTPFMLLALWAFLHGSERMHAYVWNHPRFGPTVRAWKQHRAIPLRAKVSSIIVMSLSASFLIFFSDIGWQRIIPALVLMAVGATYVLTRPTLTAAMQHTNQDNSDSTTNTSKT